MRAAADGLRAELAGELATFVVNRNVNFTNVCTVGCAFCGFGQGRRSPDAYLIDRRRLRRPDRGGDRVRRDRDLHAGRHPSRLHARALRPLAAPGEGGRAAAPPARLLADGGALHGGAIRAARRGGLRLPDRLRPRLDAGDRGRGPRRRRPHADLTEQAAGRALGRDHRGRPRSRYPDDLDGDVRSHRGAAASWPSTCALSVACRSGPAGSRSSCRSASSRSRRCSAARTASRRSARTRTSSTRPPSAWRSAARVRNLQASWVKMGVEAATESLRWGVNDLGGTLMEESISRMAGSQHGVRLEPSDLIARRAPRRPHAGPADDALRGDRDLLIGLAGVAVGLRLDRLGLLLRARPPARRPPARRRPRRPSASAPDRRAAARTACDRSASAAAPRDRSPAAWPPAAPAGVSVAAGSAGASSGA